MYSYYISIYFFIYLMWNKVFENNDLFEIITHYILNYIERKINDIELKTIYSKHYIDNNKRIVLTSKRKYNSYRLYNSKRLYHNNKLFT